MSVHRIMLSCLLAAIILLQTSNPALAQENVKPRLAILPFALNGAEDLAYLRAGVRTMLASRIAAKAAVNVIGRGEVENVIGGQVEYDLAVVAEILGADLALTGSITAFGDSVSIDARLIRVASNDSESFFASAENQSGVIRAVDQLAADLAADISGVARRIQPVAQTQVSTQVSAKPDGLAGQSLHPDRLFNLPAPAPAPVKVPLALPTATAVPVISSFPVAISPSSATQSQFLDLEVQVMDVGDVFGDGSDQIIIAEKQKITVFSQEGNRLVKAGVVPSAPRYVKIIALNLADLNDNGRAEIYISAVSDNNPLSYAVEWDGRNFVKLFDKQRHYLRPILRPGKGWDLYGQQSGYDSPVKAGIYKADFRGGSLSSERLDVPDSVNLFEFILGDFTGDGQLEVAAQTQDDDLLLYSSGGDVLWKGSGNFGYTARYLGPAYSGRLSEDMNLQILTRLIAVDLNGDGRLELVTMKNPSGVASLIKTVGSFVGGSINVMGWNGATFVDLWSSGEIGSYVASYQISGEKPRLYIGLVSKKGGGIFKSLRSIVAGYSLESVVR